MFKDLETPFFVSFLVWGGFICCFSQQRSYHRIPNNKARSAKQGLVCSGPNLIFGTFENDSQYLPVSFSLLQSTQPQMSTNYQARELLCTRLIFWPGDVDNSHVALLHWNRDKLLALTTLPFYHGFDIKVVFFKTCPLAARGWP